jgi:threonine/homoserine/homoserine lactone efflux protein
VKAMEAITDFYLFLLSVIFISLSGVMMPGPLFAVTVAKGSKHKIAGILISLGHGVIEFPLMFLIYFGFAQFLASNAIQRIIGLIGGLLMVYLGFRMIKIEKKTGEEHEGFSYDSLTAGILTTGANPYFLLWWATVGAALIINSAIFGFVGFLVFAITHWFCDLLWNTFVTITVFKSKRFWTKKVRDIIFGFCFLVMVGFGLWFIISALF